MKENTFEKALEKLEKIVEELESGSLPLDGSLKRYEDGIKLARECQKRLDKAKGKIETLAKNDKGEFEMKQFKK